LEVGEGGVRRKNGERRREEGEKENGKAGGDLKRPEGAWGNLGELEECRGCWEGQESRG